MASIERKINGTFAPVPGGYARQIDPQTTLFVPDFSASRYDPETGELFGYAPDYAALEAEKAPAAPVVWLSGDTKPHAKAIEADGGKWSGKKNAYYFRVA